MFGEIRNRRPDESPDKYIEYLTSLLKYTKDESLKSYLLDIINSLKSQKKILSETGNSIIHDINGALEEDDKQTIVDKLILFQNLLRGKSKSESNTEEDPVSLEYIKKANAQAASTTMGQKDNLPVKIGDIIIIQPGTIIYNNSSMEGLGTNLDKTCTKNPFMVDKIIYYEKKEVDGQLQWVEMSMNGNIQDVINDYGMRVCYNPSQYCKICHISQCTDAGQIIPSGTNGYIHSCEYELLNVKEEEEEFDLAA